VRLNANYTHSIARSDDIFKFRIACDDCGVFPDGSREEEGVGIGDCVDSLQLRRFINQIVGCRDESKVELDHVSDDAQLRVFAKVFFGDVDDFAEVYDLEKRLASAGSVFF
jgi:hypothetical protein